MEPSTPVSRRNQLLADAKPVLLVTDQVSSVTVTDLSTSVTIRSFTEILSQGQELDVLHALETHSCNDTMYVMYTSGSTGRPKGVVVPYRAMYNRFQWMWKTYPWIAGDVQLWKTSVVFGDCIWEMLGGLLDGVPTVVASATTVRDPYLLLQLIQRTAVTRITLIPTMLSSLLKLLPTMISGCLTSLRYVVASGEALPKVVCKQFLVLLPNALLLNLYGSTEIGNDATCYEVHCVNEEDETIPIGKPISNIYCKIVNDELWIAGDGLCIGYLNNFDMTAAKFVTDVDGRQYFKTGDRVCECVRTGELLFFGRVDTAQVKIRGARVELEEVEAVCMHHPLVHECACFIHTEKSQLIAVVRCSSTDLSNNDLRQYLSSQLPDFEVPSVFILVNTPIPRTASGKIDRKLLLALHDIAKQNDSDDSKTIIVPRDENTQRIMCLWCDALGICYDDENSSQLTFTELGGHSLVAIQLQYKIQYEFGVQVSIDQFFRQTIVTDIIKFIQNSAPINLSPRISMKSYQTAPLTLAQKGIWIADELLSSSVIPVYNVSYAFEILRNDITADQIKDAVYILVQRHDSLRMIFSRNTSGEIYQTMIPLNSDLTISGIKIFQEVVIENRDETYQILVGQARTKFDLSQLLPICRFFLCINTSQRILNIVLHHLITDGWSMNILVRDLESILTSQTLPPIAMQFLQHAQLEHQLEPHAYADDLVYWKNKLSNGTLTTTRLLHDHEISQLGRMNVGRVQIVFPSDVTDLIRAISKNNDVTPFMVLFTTFTSLLARYTQETDVIVSIPVANRTRPEVEHTIGLFTNTLALRTNLTGSSTFVDLLSRVKKTVLDAFDHQAVPFVKVLSVLEHLQRNQHQDALAQIIFAYQNVENEPIKVLRKVAVHEQAATFEVDIQVWSKPTSFLIEAHFRSDLFQTSSIERLLRHWLHITRSALSNTMNSYIQWSIAPDNDALSITSAVQPRQFDEHFRNKNLCHFFLEQVKLIPSAIAIEDGSIHLTYQQVWQNSTDFAHSINKLLISSSNQCVAIRMRRGADLIQAIWSILISGNYYFYIDSALPAERQQFILQDTRASLMITDCADHVQYIPTIQYQLSEVPSTTHVLDLTQNPTELAYILYTSGSTGLPKGVCASHNAIVARMVHVNYHSIQPQTRVGQMSTFSFDMSTFETFATLLNGGTMVIIAPESTCSTRALLELQLDIISPSTAVLNILVQQEGSRSLFASLRKIYFGGEKVNVKYLRRAMESQVLNKFVHVYGPTETTVFALFYELCDSIPDGAMTIPIGRPLTNTHICIIDDAFQLMPRGIPGELLIGGVGLDTGYHNRPDLTQQKFICNPFGEGHVYCTGDICRMHEDGSVEFLRRLDTQVKLRSQRLELGEIEFHLLQHELITDTVVLLREDIIDEEQHLVGYVQASHASTIQLDPEQIRAFLAKRLPDYMVPAYIVVMTEFLLNHVGKVNKKSLPKPQRQTSSLNGSDMVRRLLSTVLKQTKIDMNASFFQLGGHSLSAMEISARLYENLNVKVTLPILFQMKSMADLARYVEEQASKKTEMQLPESMKASSGLGRAPLTQSQEQFWLFWKLKPSSCYYNVPIALKISGPLDIAKLTHSLHHLMSKYVLLRAQFQEASDGTLWQEEKKDWSLPLVNECIEGTLQTPQVLKRLKYHSMKTFDLNKGDVCRFTILHLSDNQNILLICFHHIVCDGQSASRFIDELFDLYALESSILQLKSYSQKSFFDYANRICRTSLDKNNLESVVNNLRDFRSLTFDTDFGNEQEHDVDLKSHVSTFLVSSEVAQRLRQLAVSHNCTLYTVLLTLAKCLLSVYCSNTSDIVLGSIISTRSQPGVSDLFGPLINTVPIRTKLLDETTTTFIDLLEQVRASTFFSMEHQMVPFADIVQRLRSVSTDSSLFTYLPVVRVLFEMNSYNLFNRKRRFPDRTEWASLNAYALLSPYTKSDIDFEIMDYGADQPFQVTFNLNCNKFRLEVANTMADCYRCAIETIAHHPTCLKTQLWQRLHLTREQHSDLVLHERFRRQVEARSEHPAIVYQNQVWTYTELLRRAEQIASHLCENNVRLGDVVALYMSRCAYLIAAMFGVLMTGATYLYLDPELSAQRIRTILQDAGVKIVIADDELRPKPLVFESVRLFFNDILDKNFTQCVLFPIVSSSASCYTIYTSGSTGEPKGIKIQHQAVAQRIQMPVPIASSSNVAQITSCSFDVYILEVYGALLNGATLVIYDKTLIFQPKLLCQQIIEQHITHMYLPTPIFNILAEYVPDVFANMECVLFAGDRANAKLMRTVMLRSEPPKRLINAYGPTESTCIVTWYDTSLQLNGLSDDSQAVPIGVALPDTPLYIVNPITLTLVEDGEQGELLIGGYGVCDGYVNNIVQTESKFLLNRYGGDNKVYRTGDRVRRDLDGNLQFLGRLDTQVKVNGYRIEVSEIEHALQGYTTITETVVVVRDDIVPSTQSIVAYVRPKKQIETDIRHYLASRLPSYMLPSFIIPVDDIPICFSGGKRDAKHLPLPTADIPKKDCFSEVESKVQLAWNKVLRNNQNEHVFRINDDFFACGGTSINIVRLHTQLESQFGLSLDIMRLFELRTVSAQVTWLTSLQPTIEVMNRFQSSNIPTRGFAIIGMSARYGSVETPTDLWTALRSGADFCAHKTQEEFIQQNPSMADMVAKNPAYVHAGSTMSNANCFDHVFFGMTKRDAEITDPQHRIMLEATYEALENAGLVPQNYTGTIGMFEAVYRNTYADYYNLLRANPYDVYDTNKETMGITTFDPATIMRVEIGNMIDGAPTFISYKLGFTGPSMAIQTACSSSGTALHMALRSIEAGDCTVAVVAGVCITYPLGMGYNYQPGMIMSKTGRCRSFDECADGVVGGDGAGVVVLMKASEAAADGYPIRGIITGFGINNDGQNKISFSTTSPDMQARCMRKALAMAEIQYPQNEIDYIEAHGPGTQIGDLLEMQALTKAYRNEGQLSERKAYLGSIKTNVGHTAHAATLAGLIKIVLSLEAGEIPSTLNFHRFSSITERLQPPFQVNTQTIPWPSSSNGSRPRRAGLNALGQGGTNTHFIIEQGYATPGLDEPSEHHIFLLSAKTHDTLSKVKQLLAMHLSKINDQQLANVAFTLACGRIAHEKRCFAVAASNEELIQQLLNTKMQTESDQVTDTCVVFVFPGQGSQYGGMARQLYNRFPHVCAPVIDVCLRELQQHDNDVHQTIRTCLFDETFDDQVILIRYAQIILFIVEYSLATLLLSLNIRPNYLIGHSSGEFVAACVAETMTLKDAVRLLARRCQLMMTVPSGAMLAIEVDSSDDELALGARFDVDLAAINSPTQHVYSGTKGNIQKLEAALRKRGTKVKMLDTLTGFHSRLMDDIGPMMADYVNSISLQEPTIPIISTVTARIVSVGEMTRAQYWCDHLRQPVLFGPCLTYMLENDLITNDTSTIFIPVGSGKALCSLLSRAVPKATLIDCPLSRHSPSALFHMLGSMWTKIISINWTEYFRGIKMRRVELPTYPFERTICVADNRATFTTTKSSPKISSMCKTNDLFEIVNERQASCKLTELQNSGKKAPPWKIPKQTSVAVKLLDLSVGTSVSVKVAPAVKDDMQLKLGSCSALFVQALYHEALEMGLIQSHDFVMQYVPSDYRLSTVNFTMEDLSQGKVDTSTVCITPIDLLTSLQQITSRVKDNENLIPNVFTLSLLGHILAVLHDMSYDEIVQDRIVSPLELKQTCADISLSTEAYYPATGMRSSIEDLQTILTSSIPISRAFRKALSSNYVRFTDVEQLIAINHPNDLNKALILASEQSVQKTTFQSVIDQKHCHIDKTVQKLSINYEDIVQQLLMQLLGSSDQSTASNFTSLTPFEQLGIDSLQAITFVELLSQKFGMELPVDIIFNYSNIKSLSEKLAQFCSINHHSEEPLQEYILIKQARMPHVYESTTTRRSLSALLSFVSNHKMKLLKELHQCGALLFRGFDVDTAEEFSQVVELLAEKNKTFLDYRDGISPRTRLTDKVFTSTDYPKQFDMALHNEMSYSFGMPSMIFFFCQVPPDEGSGGETPIGNSAAIYNGMDPNIRQEFIQKQVLYVTNLPSKAHGIGLGKSWQDTYQTESKEEVEAFLKDKLIQFKWLPNDRLRTIRRCEAVRQHPITGETVWCNHAHLFHPTDLHESTRHALQKRFDPLDLPKNCFFGNGDIIPDTSLVHVRQVLKQHELKWPWQKGDILVLDNLRTAHGRAMFNGHRRILVAMC